MIPLAAFLVLVVVAALSPSDEDTPDDAATTTTTEPDSPAMVSLAELEALNPNGVGLWSEVVCELRTNWGSDVEQYRTNLLTVTNGAENDMSVIAENTSSDDEIVALADDVILAECPEALNG